MAKRMCKWDKSDLDKKFDKYCELVKAPKVVCAKCGRVASDAKLVCKARKID